MAKDKRPSRIEVQFVEADGRITAKLRDPFKGEMLEALDSNSETEMMAQLRNYRDLYGTSFTFEQPWPPRMSRFLKDGVEAIRKQIEQMPNR